MSPRLSRAFARLRPTRARLRWVGVRALLGLAFTYLAYLAVFNVVLRTSLGKSLLDRLDPAHGKFDYDSAYTVWFGRVHTKGFVVRGTDSAVEWRITTDEATATFQLRDLFDRRVHLYDTTARGVSVRIRFKVTAPTPEYLAALPPIEGLPDPPLKPPPKPELTDANYNLWSVQVDDIDAEDIREVWIDTVRFTDAGGGRAVGSFFFKPLRRVRVDPSEYTARQGTIEIGAATIASDIHGTFGVTIAELDPRVPTGRDALSSLDAHAVAVAMLTDLSWADRWLLPEMALTMGGGPLDVSARVRRGVLEPGSRLDFASRGWMAWSGRNWGSGTSLVHARVPTALPSRTVVAIESYAVELHRDRARVAAAPALGVVVTFDETDLAKSFERWRLHYDLANASVSKLTSLNGYFDAGPFYDGSAALDLHGDADPKGASGKLAGSLANATFRTNGSTVRASGTVALTVRRYDFASTLANCSLARIDLHDVATGTLAGYWIHASASPLDFAVRTSTLSASVSGSARDAKLPLALVDAPGIATTLVGDRSIAFAATLRISPTTKDLGNVRLVADGLDVYGHYRSDPTSASGAALVSTPSVNVGFDIREGGVRVHPFASRRWYIDTDI